MFYVAAVMLAVGMSGQEPPLKAFLADQLRKKENPNEEEPEQIEGRTKVWWRIARFSGATIALFCLPNALWEKAFKVSALVMGANLLLFLFGYIWYLCLRSPLLQYPRTKREPTSNYSWSCQVSYTQSALQLPSYKKRVLLEKPYTKSV